MSDTCGQRKWTAGNTKQASLQCQLTVTTSAAPQPGACHHGISMQTFTQILAPTQMKWIHGCLHGCSIELAVQCDQISCSACGIACTSIHLMVKACGSVALRINLCACHSCLSSPWTHKCEYSKSPKADGPSGSCTHGLHPGSKAPAHFSVLQASDQYCCCDLHASDGLLKAVQNPLTCCSSERHKVALLTKTA